MNNWRLLTLETHNAYANMAIDEAVMQARIRNEVQNTLRFYQWKPAAVSIGKFQSLVDEVQLENCDKLGVDVVRRITGGGTVYHSDHDEITYSVVANKRSLDTSDILDIYSHIYSGLVETLRLLDVKADFDQGNEKTCPNLTVKNRKISGSAQSHKNGVVLQHGTLLLAVDLERMFALLKAPWSKAHAEILDIAKNRITSISKELGRTVAIEEVHKALVQGFETALGIRLKQQELTRKEQEQACKLYNQKYSRSEWNFHGQTVDASVSGVCF